MFTEEENKIISLFYSGDYELAEQLMIATNNVKLVDKLICKIHRFLYKSGFKYTPSNLDSYYKIYFCAGDRVLGDRKDACVVFCGQLLVRGLPYVSRGNKTERLVSQRAHSFINDENLDIRFYSYEIDSITDETEFELKKLGVRLVNVPY